MQGVKLLLSAILAFASSAFAQTDSIAHWVTIDANRCASPTGMLFAADLREALNGSQRWQLAHDSTQGLVVELVCADMTFGGRPDQIAASVLATMRLKDAQPVVVVLHTLIICDKKTAASTATELWASVDRQFK